MCIASFMLGVISLKTRVLTFLLHLTQHRRTYLFEVDNDEIREEFLKMCLLHGGVDDGESDAIQFNDMLHEGDVKKKETGVFTSWSDRYLVLLTHQIQVR